MARCKQRVTHKHRGGALLVAALVAAPVVSAQSPSNNIGASPAVAAPAPPPPAGRSAPLTRETAQKQRDSFEQGWPILQAALARWTSLDKSPKDFRSVTPAVDFNGYVFTPDERKTLEARRKEAKRQYDGGDWPGAILEYGTLITQTNGVIARLREVGGYWMWYTNHERRMTRWSKTVVSNRLANPQGPEIEAAEARLKVQIRANQFGAASKANRDRIDELFDQAVAEARAGAPGGALRDDPLRRLPDKPCADGTPEMVVPPAETVALSARLDDRKSKPADGYYPRVARYNGTQGVATVRTLNAASGCVVYAEIQQTSGSDLLDDAALDWAVDGAVFIPAKGADQKPTPAFTVFNVRFALIG